MAGDKRWRLHPREVVGESVLKARHSDVDQAGLQEGEQPDIARDVWETTQLRANKAEDRKECHLSSHTGR